MGAIATATLTLGQLSLTTGRLAKSGGASLALNDGRGVREDSAVELYPNGSIQDRKTSVRKEMKSGKK